ncbi:phospholipase A2 inhibitor and Ly6/PLAUR domain-containing protein-like [Thamnophis elegans]|uniref:phospholipase A2 inhibitor and Ly6/PLAUR domain-containing protein-like n=1 Tax=Thamnophis elegans TaxID=35005 RepID=UPI0013784524|nr:phospholipase A2 inhibitor and Ly6/PLAUR domain-containing protein-like [Thamnophis elegans]
MKMVECKANEGHCLTLSFRSTMNTPTLSLAFKGCARTDQCAKGYYSGTSLADKHKQTRVACCESDGCNSGPLPIPRHNDLKPNGLTCPGVYEENGSSIENGTVLCLGNEVQCYNAKLRMHALAAFPVTINVKGCATQNVCTYPKGETETGNGLLRFNIEKMECQNPQGMEGWNAFSKTLGWGWN